MISHWLGCGCFSLAELWPLLIGWAVGGIVLPQLSSKVSAILPGNVK